MDSMDEKLMQFLQNQFAKITEQFDKVDKRFDEMDKRFTDEFKSLREELAIIKEQTARNSEMLFTIETHEKRLSDLETDVRIIKKLVEK